MPAQESMFPQRDYFRRRRKKTGKVWEFGIAMSIKSSKTACGFANRKTASGFGSLLLRISDLHHFEFLAAFCLVKLAFIRTVAVENRHVATLDRLFGHWVEFFPLESQYLARLVKLAMRIRDARAHVVHPRVDVFRFEIVVADEAAAEEFHAAKVALHLLMQIASTHDPLGFGAAFRFNRRRFRVGWIHPHLDGKVPGSGHWLKFLVHIADLCGLHHGLHDFSLIGR